MIGRLYIPGLNGLSPWKYKYIRQARYIFYTEISTGPWIDMEAHRGSVRRPFFAGVTR